MSDPIVGIDLGPSNTVVAYADGAGAVRVEGATYTVQGRGDDFVTAVIRFVAGQALTVRDFRTVFPTLEDVFLKLTGHAIRD